MGATWYLKVLREFWATPALAHHTNVVAFKEWVDDFAASAALSPASRRISLRIMFAVDVVILFPG